MSGFFDNAGGAAGSGAALAGPLAAALYLLYNWKRELTLKLMADTLLVAGFFALLGGLFGIMYSGYEHLH